MFSDGEDAAASDEGRESLLAEVGPSDPSHRNLDVAFA
jgi:hypothetical protein